MTVPPRPTVAVVDYGLGNLFSVRHACAHAGLDAFITGRPADVFAAHAVLLPGVGAFGDAMDGLRRRDLVAPLRARARSGKLLIGVCLGQQLLMTVSHEFGRHEGLGLIEGDVVRFAESACPGRPLKVPQVGWNRIRRPPHQVDPWADTPLAGLRDGEPMYFVHSFYTRPADSGVVLARTHYGPTEFCSALRQGNTFAFQFHPERSGPEGMRIYHNIAALIRSRACVEEVPHAA
jgi:glutamine amidotransferase